MELALEDSHSQQQRAGNSAAWNSIQAAVLSLFQRRSLVENELFLLNEGVRQLLKTELGSFFTEYLQSQLLSKGMKLLDSLVDTWDFFFCDVLPMLQAIFYPVQGKDPSVRQLALLLFRNIIALSVKLEEALSRPHTQPPPGLTHMLLILQGVHEPGCVSSEYLRLECLVQKVVSPYLGTLGLFYNDRPVTHCSCLLEKRLRPTIRNPVLRSKSYNAPLPTAVVRCQSYNAPLPSSVGRCQSYSTSRLTPVVEHDCSEAGSGKRRHSFSQIRSCPEEEQVPEQELDLDCNSDQNPSSLDSDTEGIFIRFPRRRSSSDSQSKA
ncbi:hypothetical protein DNTS_018763 [Danionella cerebrum]|uniref:Proline-rich protein 5 n=1 Tax=Danionella cerebrum TaxID=2873325 RepID=A0A553PYD7_9TELE|nr:hypothetical protein DNTS_018763 [Danionella translucida]